MIENAIGFALLSVAMLGIVISDTVSTTWGIGIFVVFSLASAVWSANRCV